MWFCFSTLINYKRKNFHQNSSLLRIFKGFFFQKIGLSQLHKNIQKTYLKYQMMSFWY